jgi:glycosyltransferase involved in cell wall biosynthesis
MSSGSSELPDIAVVVITYNHEQYIAECLQSVFDQEYPGNIHLVVSDDCSTDGTRAVIETLLPGAPVIVHPILRDENVGGLRNLSAAWDLAQKTGCGYVALLEGDDYWTTPHKLALQVGALEANPRATLSFGLATELDATVDPPSSTLAIFPTSDHLQVDDLLLGNFIHTCTVVYRVGVLPSLPAWFAECAFRDWPLHLVHAAAGEMLFLERVVAVHRQHATSRWWNAARNDSDRIAATINIQDVVMRQLDGRVHVRPSQIRAQRHLWWAKASQSKLSRLRHLFLALALRPGLIRRHFIRRRRARALASIVADG